MDERRAIGYVRVSSEGQVDGYSLDHQRDVIRRWCKERGITLQAIIDNDGRAESGVDPDRAGLVQLSAAVAAGGIGWVVVSKIDRLVRNLRLHVELLRTWSEKGVNLIAVEDGITNPDGTNTNIIINLLAFMAEMEHGRILGRIRPGLRARAAAGLHLGAIPFGYQASTAPPTAGSGSRRAKLEIDPATAPIVQALFHHALHDGWGPDHLASWARREHPQRKWSPQQIRYLLANRIYLGEHSAEVGGQRMVIPDNHPALVTIADFDAIQQLTDHRRKDASSRINDAAAVSLLGGIGACHLCGEKVSVRIIDGEPHYVCGSGLHGVGCASTPQECMGVDIHFFNQFLILLGEFLAEHLQELVRGGIDDLPRHLDECHARAVREQAALKRENVRCVDELTAGTLSLENYAVAMKAANERGIAAERLLKETDGWRILADLVALKNDGQGAYRWVPLPVAWAHLSLVEKRSLLRASLRQCKLLLPKWPWCELTFAESLTAFAGLEVGFSRALLDHPGIDPEATMLKLGFTVSQRSADGRPVWVHPQSGQSIILPIPIR
jgi:DNA invertase Pin-like site-specific DNA recombinase